MSIGEPARNSDETVHRPLWALGLMSGTSLDGIDLALIRSDGVSVLERGAVQFESYSDGLRDALRAVLGGNGDTNAVERELTIAHAAAVARFLKDDQAGGLVPDIIGFHGHTILHQPGEGRTWQIGDGQLLADRTGVKVVGNMRGNDVAHGGQGAPIAPLYHAALGWNLERPFAVLNIGGVANVTWIGLSDDNLMAFDTGPGGGQLDEWAECETGERFDRDGALARSGVANKEIVAGLLRNPYFSTLPPKSLDRIDFSIEPVKGQSPADGAATLLEFTCAAIARAADFLPEPPRQWLVTGGGRKNGFMMERLGDLLAAPVNPVEMAGWDGDALEAQAFAYLAVRNLYGLPLTLPGTTGVDRPRTGGKLFSPAPG